MLRNPPGPLVVAALAAAVIFSAVALLAHAQSTIRGRVVADETGDPIPNARVSLTPAAAGVAVVLADADGQFTLQAPAGRVSVIASKSGYARLEMTPAAGQPLEVRLRKGAAISGRVVDEFGEPLPGTRVEVETASASAAGFTSAAATTTDDRGEYRLASLPPAGLVVAVTTVGVTTALVVGNGQVIYGPAAIQKTYYPGVATPNEAQQLRLQAGDDRRGIDFVVSADQSDNQPNSVFPTGGAPGPLARALAAAAAAPATGVLRGRVTSTDGRALPHAQVRAFVMNGLPAQPRFGRVDEDGRFEFRQLPAGKYRVDASKAGYSATPADAVIIDLGEGQTRERADITLARWGTVEGRVFDEHGDPLQGARVEALHVRYEAGRRRLVAARGAARLTDDLGRYRLYSLAPGQYVVSAAVGTVSSADLPGYTRSYFPGTSNPGAAQFVAMGLSQDIVNVDFPMSRTPTARVAGRLLNAAGEPTTRGGALTLMPSQRAASVTSVPVGARIMPDGTFEFPNVAAGQYIIQSSAGRQNGWTEGDFGAIPVVVDRADVTNLVLQTSAGSAIKGRITFDTSDRSTTPPLAGIELSPIPVDFDLSPQNNLATADVHPDGTFDLAGINGPRRLQLLRAPAGWALKEIRAGRIDVTDRPLAFGRANQSMSDVEVVLTDRVSELSGTIADDRGSAAPAAHLIVFATDRGRWYPASRFVRMTAAGTDGAFRIVGLPFGSYYAAAVAALPADGEDGWQDPQFLESLVQRASTVMVRDGQKQLLSLRLGSRER